MPMFDMPLLLTFLQGLTPPSPLLPSEFARELILPASSNALPGPLKLAPHQIEMADALTDDSVTTIVIQAAAQTGKSTVLDVMIASTMANDPCPALLIHPTSAKADDYVKSRLDPLIDSSPTLRTAVGKGALTRRGHSGGTDSLSLKTFIGGFLRIGSSFKAEDMRATSCRSVFLDETDAYATNVNGEGSPVTLAAKRLEMFKGKGAKLVMASTPKSKIGSRINEYFLRGDQRRFHCPCQQCGHEAPMHHNNLRWTPGQPETAYMVCEDCGGVITELDRLKMLALGKWTPTATPTDRMCRSYHLPQLASCFATMADVAKSIDEAVTPDQRQALWNVVFGDVYDANSEIEVNASDLEQRAITISEPLPADVHHIVCGADVQGNRVEATWLATGAPGPNGELPNAWVLNHVVFLGDTSSNTPWDAFDAEIGRIYRTADGRELTTQIIAVDAGWSVDAVIKFVLAQRQRRRRCFAIRGFFGFNRQAIKEGGKLKGIMRVWLVGVDSVKHHLLTRLAVTEGAFGRLYLPSHLPAEYFDQVASETLTAIPKHGYTEFKFVKKPTIRNEALDALTYAYAVSTLAKPDRGLPQAAQPIQQKPTTDALDVMSAVFNTGVKTNG